MAASDCIPGTRRRTAIGAAAGTPAAIGIDLGTTNSVVAVLRKGDHLPAVLRADGRGALGSGSGDAAFTIPSIAAVDASGSWLVGEPARLQAAGNPLNTFYSVKRLIGRMCSEVAATQLVYRLGEGPGGEVLLECPRLGTMLKPEEVSAEVLRQAVQLAARYVDDDVTEAVVTTPAYFTETQRAATVEAARLAGLTKVSLLQEPVAAAMAFGFGKPLEADTILVFDLGGGTYDVSVLESFEGIMEVLATAGDSQLGGDDYDRALVSLLLHRLSESSSPAAASAAAADPSGAALLLRAAEAAKIRLSSCSEAEVNLTAIPAAGYTGGPVSLDTVVTAEDLLDATAALRSRLWPPLASAAEQCKLSFPFDGPSFESVLQQARQASSSGSGCSREMLEASAAAATAAEAQISGSQSGRAGAAQVVAVVDKYAPKPRMATAAVLVGGATRMPVVRDFTKHLTGLKPRTEIDPEQCVALGAAIHGGILLGLTSGVELMDGSYVEELHKRSSGFQV